MAMVMAMGMATGVRALSSARTVGLRMALAGQASVRRGCCGWGRRKAEKAITVWVELVLDYASRRRELYVSTLH